MPSITARKMMYKKLDPSADWDAWCQDHPAIDWETMAEQLPLNEWERVEDFDHVDTATVEALIEAPLKCGRFEVVMQATGTYVHDELVDVTDIEVKQ